VSFVCFESLSDKGAVAEMLLEKLVLVIVDLDWDNVFSCLAWEDLNDEVF